MCRRKYLSWLDLLPFKVYSLLNLFNYEITLFYNSACPDDYSSVGPGWGGESSRGFYFFVRRKDLDQLESTYPGFKEKLYSEDGELRRFINIYVNEEDIRFLDSDSSAVKDGDTISIIPAIAGGQ